MLNFRGRGFAFGDVPPHDVEHDLPLERDGHERYVDDELPTLSIEMGPVKPVQPLAVSQCNHLGCSVRRALSIGLKFR